MFCRESLPRHRANDVRHSERAFCPCRKPLPRSPAAASDGDPPCESQVLEGNAFALGGFSGEKRRASPIPRFSKDPADSCSSTAQIYHHPSVRPQLDLLQHGCETDSIRTEIMVDTQKQVVTVGVMGQAAPSWRRKPCHYLKRIACGAHPPRRDGSRPAALSEEMGITSRPLSVLGPPSESPCCKNRSSSKQRHWRCDRIRQLRGGLDDRGSLLDGHARRNRQWGKRRPRLARR